MCEGERDFSFTVSFTSFTTDAKGFPFSFFDRIVIVSGVKEKCLGEGRLTFGEGCSFTPTVLIVSDLRRW